MLTHSFSETVQDQLRANVSFRHALLREALGTMLAGDVETGKTVLADFIEGTIGFQGLSEALDCPESVLREMFGVAGNPPISNFFAIVAYLQKVEGAAFEVTERPAA